MAATKKDVPLTEPTWVWAKELCFHNGSRVRRGQKFVLKRGMVLRRWMALEAEAFNLGFLEEPPTPKSVQEEQRDMRKKKNAARVSNEELVGLGQSPVAASKAKQTEATHGSKKGRGIFSRKGADDSEGEAE